MRCIFKNTTQGAMSSNLFNRNGTVRNLHRGPLSTGLIPCKLSHTFQYCHLIVCTDGQAQPSGIPALHPKLVQSTPSLSCAFWLHFRHSQVLPPRACELLTLWYPNWAGTGGDIGRQGAGFSACLCAERSGRSSALLASATCTDSRGRITSSTLGIQIMFPGRSFWVVDNEQN